VPRLSLFRPEKGNNYKFFDKQISRMFQAGGVDVYLHKYLGPKVNTTGTADQPIYDSLDVTNIQDLLFLENRDRKYDEEIYKLRGFYKVSDIDFNLSQFGMFIDNDTLFMTVHINDFISFIGRKPMSGDVFELPNLKDDFALNDYDISLPRYYVIEDVGRASEGFSVTWYPHLYRLKLKKITDNQQFSDILDKPASEDSNFTLRDLLSTHRKEMEISNQVLAQAEADAPLSGYETQQFYTLAMDPVTNRAMIVTADSDSNASSGGILASEVNAKPLKDGYSGYLLGDGIPYNGYNYGQGIQFPNNPENNDFFLRTDFLPNRLFKFIDNKWSKVEDAVRTTMTNTNTRDTLKFGFINNTKFIYHDVIGTDDVRLLTNDIVVVTNINYVNAPYVVLKESISELDFSLADHPNLIENRLVNGIEKIVIHLPIINNIQQTIPYDGVWTVSLYNTRESQRQSLSKALKPKADF